MTNGIYILLGSNLGDKKKNLNQAKELIGAHLGGVLRMSKIYETAAWGKTDQPSFYNQVIEIKSSLSPEQMLRFINYMELSMGRIRKEKWDERIIDIDILYYNEKIVDKPHLKVPHPGIPERKFTLIPLVELSPDFLHPVLQRTNKALLEDCKDILKVDIVI